MSNGVEVVFNRFPEIVKKLPVAANSVVENTLESMYDFIEASMSAEKHGHIYGEHQASAPGEAPAIDMGELMESIQLSRNSVYTYSPYAPIMEWGAPGANILPRPFMQPAAEAVWPGFLDQMSRLEKFL